MIILVQDIKLDIGVVENGKVKRVIIRTFEPTVKKQNCWKGYENGYSKGMKKWMNLEKCIQIGVREFKKKTFHSEEKCFKSKGKS